MTREDEATFQIDAQGDGAALLLHGYMGSPRELRPLAAALAEAGVTARAELMPGFGEAGRPHLKRVRAEEWLEAAKAAWREVTAGASHRTLLGYSMGGAVALALSVDPEVRPDQLILLAPYWRMADPRAALLPVAHYVMPQFEPFGRLDFADPATRERLAKLAPDADLDDPAVQQGFQDGMRVPTHSLLQVRRIGMRARKARPEAPVTIIQGLEDPTTLPRDSRDLTRMTGAALIEVPANHALVADDGPAWAQIRDAVVSRATGAG
ncbi:MAG: alpha/beta fold hydrolase [Thermomicrobiales bacterium]